MISIDFSKQEIQVLVKLLDLAVKAGGLGIAGDAAFLFNKIAEATKQSEVVKTEE